MRIGIFGAGQAGAMAARWLPAGQELVCFLDNDKKKQGQLFSGVPVCSLREALEAKLDKIWIAVLNQEACAAIAASIREAGYQGSLVDIQEFRNRQDIRLAALRLIAGEIKSRGIPGAMAELGVYQGAFAAEMNRLLPEKKIYLFDTFTGFDQRDVELEDLQGKGGRARDFSDTSVERVRNILPCPEQAVFCQGHFPESLAALSGGLPKLALVSLDPDLYGPVYEGLKIFYPLLNPGAMILIHDYNSMQFPGVKKAVLKYCEENGLFVVPLMDLHGSAVLVKPAQAG